MTAGWGGLSKLNLTRLQGHADAFIPLLQLIQKFSWLSFLTGILVAACTFAMKAIGPPWVRHAVKNVLDEMHQHAFGESNRAEFHDRITLFKYEAFCIKGPRTRWSPFGGHLVPFVRSGFITQKSSVVFRAPDDGDFEGVAGFAYSCNISIEREHLPDVAPGSSPTKKDFEKYASETYVTADWLKKERSSARSLYGLPVRVDGKPWGAIVIDSRQEAIPDSANVIKSYYLVATVLGQLIKRS